MSRAEFSRRRYRTFVQAYKSRTLEDPADTEHKPLAGTATEPSRRKQYLRQYVAWLWPHRFTIAGFFALALLTAGLEMIEPLFMRFIIDRVLLNETLDRATRLSHLHFARSFFVGVPLLGHLERIRKGYRHRLLNAHGMRSRRHSLFARLLPLPLPRLWDMKTGGILPRLTGAVETTSGLLQMAVISPAMSVIRLDCHR